MISRQGWVRFALRASQRHDHPHIMSELCVWFDENGKGQCMIDHGNHWSNAAIALSDQTDCVLFRLTFGHLPFVFVPQPHSHELV